MWCIPNFKVENGFLGGCRGSVMVKSCKDPNALTIPGFLFAAEIMRLDKISVCLGIFLV